MSVQLSPRETYFLAALRICSASGQKKERRDVYRQHSGCTNIVVLYMIKIKFEHSK